MAISIREHCVPAYDILSRLRKVAPIPPELDGMEQKTGGGDYQENNSRRFQPLF